MSDQYTIKKGDTLYSLAKKNGTTVEALAALNKIKDPSKISIGQKIKFPKAPSGLSSGFPSMEIAKIAAGIVQAEHRGRNPKTFTYDPRMFIRTRHQPKRGSTAYGPGQITASTARDLLTRAGDLLTPEARQYIENTFLPAGKLMVQHGGFSKSEKKPKGYLPDYDYGGAAGMAAQENFVPYNQMFGAVIERKLQDAGVTAADVVKGGDARDKFLDRYYKDAGRESAYDTSVETGINQARPIKMPARKSEVDLELEGLV